ncbi:hypothetical protein G6O69_30680 [Pseudenhygromyxa sp. WMMC2535]|uniref:hypothetical protein n=1 Tax=Pseudenhygromyxa sp. WMMC2535 TaxID=2712867 RepID=UPI0015958F99|nr:hypothetical protein [Pseudenhygromyxa sp. WMMC2535]NVB42229.1 hypothetical protein [Pseudenhygromyxa sp. WMMC2535]
MGEIAGPVGWVIESEGLPNLLHELVHALFLGHLDDDHGFDYGLIPLDVGRADHRRHLWEELACCVISVDYAAPFAEDPRSFAREWFAEQFEIQGVFYGLEHDLRGLREMVDDLLSSPARLDEAEGTLTRGRALVARALRERGWSAPAGFPDRWPSFRAVWDGYRRACAPTPGAAWKKGGV